MEHILSKFHVNYIPFISMLIYFSFEASIFSFQLTSFFRSQPLFFTLELCDSVNSIATYASVTSNSPTNIIWAILGYFEKLYQKTQSLKSNRKEARNLDGKLTGN